MSDASAIAARPSSPSLSPATTPLDGTAAGSSSAPPFTGREIEWLHSVLPEWTSYPFAGLTLLGEVWLFVFVLSLALWFGRPRRIVPLFGVVYGGLALLVVAKAAFATP